MLLPSKKKAENELRASEQKFASIYNLSPDKIGIVRQRDMVITDVNETFVTEIGFSRGEIINKTFLNTGILPNSDDFQFVQDEMQATGEIFNKELKITNKSGDVLTILFSAKPFVYEDEIHFIFVIQDITEIKKGRIGN